MPQQVLIVDDSLPIHELVKVHLLEEAFELHSAFTGSSGLSLANSLAPDLLLLDVDLPDMNGFDVCRLLRAGKTTASIAVIFLTASASTESKVCGFDLKAVDYITKPFDPVELRVRVRSALRTKRLVDLLPKPEDEVNETPDRSAHRRVNPRLSMSQLFRARAGNPWNRQAPRELPS